MTALLDLAIAAIHNGLCVHPPAEDGTKRPIDEPVPPDCRHPDCVKVRDAGRRSWAHHKHTASNEDDARRWYGTHNGIGLICGNVSGGLEMLEFEGRAIDEGLGDQFDDLAMRAGLGDLVARIQAGYSELTPSGGIHLLYRCSEVEGNLKLARRPATPDELARDPQDKVKVLLETRGEGGFTIVAPSGGRVHPQGGAWELVHGGVTTIVTITPDERRALLNLARSFDRMPTRTPSGRAARPAVEHDAEGSPGQDFNTRATWNAILEPHGWTEVAQQGDTTLWRRPGKTAGISASTNHNGSGYLYVFSSSTVFEPERGYSKFAAYTILTEGDDTPAAFSAAATNLRRDGYGAPSLRIVRPQGDQGDPDDPGPTPPADLDDRTATDPHQIHAAAIRAADAEAADAEQHARPSNRLIDGNRFILLAPEATTAIWGQDEEVLWPQGEPLFVVGPSGVGKSTLVQQVVRARISGGQVLGWTVQPSARRVLYLAMDRPLQIARSMRRMWDAQDALTLEDRLIVWRGPLPFNILKEPERLAQLAGEADADTLIIDSTKDLAARMSDEETGSQINAAFQTCIVNSIEVLAIHHQRKAQADNKRPGTLADVYGSQMLINGAGSVILLWGEAGDPVVELTHLKQPVETIGPLQITHDHLRGHTTSEERRDAYSAVQGAWQGIDAPYAARHIWGVQDPSRSQIEKARRQLDRLVERGYARREMGGVGGNEKRPTMWYPVARNLTDPSDLETGPDE